MKKVLVFLLACLSSTVMFAQTLHYQKDWTGCGAMNTKITGVLTIDDVEVYNGEGMQYAGGGNLEIGVFDQDGICRGATLPGWRSKSNQWVYQMQFRGVIGYSVFHFKVYDHATETELDLIDDFVDEITYQGNYTYQWNGSNSGLTNLYHLNFTYPAQTFTKDIVGYGDNEGGYYLIASPISEVVTPAADNGFITSAYDLYYFDQAQNLEWINYKDDTLGGFGLVNGKGYLYASQNDTLLTFTGTPVSGDEMAIALDYTAGAELAGWNLVGNPFAQGAYLSKDFYVLNDERNEVVPAQTDTIASMEGAFVCAEGTEESVIISLNAPNKSGSLALNLTQGRGVVDRAVVRFGHGSLPKFQLNPNHTKVYIPMEGTDYAVVSAEPMGEMPVNFKAQKSGDFTLNFKAENVGFNYLHLIDNLTGADQDLLANPSYAFNASTTDYESRFKLVYATGSDNGDNFAFFSNGAFIVSNDGEAVLQVVDLNGRILSSTTISGSTAVNVDAAAGVYMLRLLNGDNVKVQKVIIK